MAATPADERETEGVQSDVSADVRICYGKFSLIHWILQSRTIDGRGNLGDILIKCHGETVMFQESQQCILICQQLSEQQKMLSGSPQASHSPLAKVPNQEPVDYRERDCEY